MFSNSFRLFKNIERWSDLNSRSCVYSSIIVMINYSKLQNITSPLGLNKDLPRAAPGTRLQWLSGLRRRVQKRHWNYTAQGSGLGWAGDEKNCVFSPAAVFRFNPQIYANTIFSGPSQHSNFVHLYLYLCCMPEHHSLQCGTGVSSNTSALPPPSPHAVSTLSTKYKEAAGFWKTFIELLNVSIRDRGLYASL